MQNIKYYEAPKENYTIVPNQIIQSQDLSDGAKILALYLLSLPKDWNICWAKVAKILKKSLSTIKKYKTELVAFEILKIEQLKDEKGKFLNKTCLLFAPFKTSQNSTSNPLRNLTAYGSDDHVQIKEYKTNKEIIITQRTHLFHTLLESFEKFRKVKTNKGKLEEFLSGAELEAGKEWVQYRKERFKIPANATISKLRIAKEEGWDIVKSVERCITNDYRGLFESKPTKQSFKQTSTKQNPQHEAEQKEILKELLKSGWRFGDSLQGVLVFGKKVEQKGGRFCYAL